MKKTIVGLALVALSFATFTGMAQNTTPAAPAKEQVKKDDRKARREARNPFEGLNLTEAQQTQLDALAGKRKAARAEKAQAGKEAKQKGDAQRKEARRAARKAYLEEVKGIIGPDRYVVFLENMYVNGGGHSKAVKQGKGGHGCDKAKGCKAGKGRRGHGDKAQADAKATCRGDRKTAQARS